MSSSNRPNQFAQDDLEAKIKQFHEKTHPVNKIILANEIAQHRALVETEKQKWIDISTENVLLLGQDKDDLCGLFVFNEELAKCVKRTLYSVPHTHPAHVSLYNCAVALGNCDIQLKHNEMTRMNGIIYFAIAKEIADKNAMPLTAAEKNFFLACQNFMRRMSTGRYQNKVMYFNWDFVLLFESAFNARFPEAINLINHLSRNSCYPVRTMALAFLNKEMSEESKLFISGLSAFYGWKCKVDHEKAKEIFAAIVTNYPTKKILFDYANFYTAMIHYAELEQYVSNKSNAVSSESKKEAITTIVMRIFNTMGLLKYSHVFFTGLAIGNIQPIALLQNTLNLLQTKNVLDEDNEIVLRKCLAHFYFRNTRILKEDALADAANNINALEKLTPISGDEYTNIFKVIAYRTHIPEQKLNALLKAAKLGDLSCVRGILYFSINDETLNEICQTLDSILNQSLEQDNMRAVEVVVNTYTLYVEFLTERNKRIAKEIMQPLHDTVQLAKNALVVKKSSTPVDIEMVTLSDSHFALLRRPANAPVNEVREEKVAQRNGLN